MWLGEEGDGRGGKGLDDGHRGDVKGLEVDCNPHTRAHHEEDYRGGNVERGVDFGEFEKYWG